MGVNWLLLRNSDRQSRGRLLLTILTITLGVGCVLGYISAINAQAERTLRMSWVTNESAQEPIKGVTPLLVQRTYNAWQNDRIEIVALRPTDDKSPQLSGIATPVDHQYYASPALMDLIQKNPLLSDRINGQSLGTVPAGLLSSPDQLLLLYGMTAAEATATKATPLYAITTDDGDMSTLQILKLAVIVVGSIMVLFPIVILLSVATQLGSRQREQRFAALRLIGATRRQINRFVLTESLLTATVGIGLGYLLFLGLRPLLTQFSLNGLRFFVSDFTVSGGQILLTIGLTLALIVIANLLGMRRVQVSPLGVARTARVRKPPRWPRILLLLASFGLMFWLSASDSSAWTDQSGAMVFLLLIVLLVLSLVIGLLVAGPWLMKIAARLVARVTKRPVVLLAMKRIAVLAPNVFRAISGVVIALFAGSFWLATMGGVTALTQTIESADGQMDMRDNTVLVRDSQPLPSNKILALPGVKQQSNIYLDDKLGLVLACRDIPAFTVLHCPAGSDTKFGSVLTERRPSGQIPSDKVTAPSDKMLAQPAEVMLLTDGKANLDAIRNIVITANGGLAENRAVVSTKATVQADYLPDSYKELSQIVYVAIAFTLALAVISLIVSTIGGMLERKRSFFTLRLGGMTVGQLRGVMLVESLLPLVVVALIASALGVWLAKVFLSVLPYSMIRADLPPTYYAIVGASIALSLVAIYVVSRGLRRMTSPETNQSE